MDPSFILQAISSELGLAASRVSATITLLDDGNTIPFIARYRKEMTGSLDEVQLRQIESRLEYLRRLDERKTSVRNEIETQGKLTPELDAAIEKAKTLQEVEDLYRPYKPRRQTRAAQARERGLGPLADLMMECPSGCDLEAEAAPYLSDDVPDIESALAGARDIVAEQASDDATNRHIVRQGFAARGLVTSEKASDEADTEGKFRTYHEFKVALRSVQPHQWLALQRGEKDGALKVRMDTPDPALEQQIEHRTLQNPASAASEHIRMAIKDGYERLLRPSVEREVAGQLGDYASDHAIRVFATNLRNLLLQPPMRNRVVMGIDPGFRTGCKAATVDATGKLLHTATIYPHPPQKQTAQALATLSAMVEQDGVTVLAIGNGTASRETETLAVELVKQHQRLAYVIVSEAGASVYSASDIAREEFPDLDVSMRGAISIARRLQDPLAELVKIDPQSIGVGLYQHDVDQKKLSAALDAVVESVVNYVGVDVNTASPALLSHIAGINKKLAAAIVAHRDENGPFATREALKKVKGLGPKAFQQSAGFLRVAGGSNTLDNTIIHPESYTATRAMLELAGLNLRMADLTHLLELFRSQQKDEDLAETLGVGVPTLNDIFEGLLRPGRDPRDDLPPVILRQDVLSIEDLREGMRLKGTVRNVVDFGAFVDIGVKHDGLVHVSKMAKKYVSNPHEVVSVGDIVDVEVIGVDLERGRVSLGMVL